MKKIFFSASHSPLAQKAFAEMTQRYGQSSLDDADYFVVLGGDGQVLSTLYDALLRGTPVFAIRRTESIGFLCNNFNNRSDLIQRLERAQKAVLNPLRIDGETTDGTSFSSLSINEVSIVRETPQAVRLRILIDGVERIAKFGGDGIMVSTPAGSTAYNHSCGGPIMPLNSNTLIITGINGFRPRGWSYAVLPQDAVTEIHVLEPAKRPVRIEAAGKALHNAVHAKIRLDKTQNVTLLFDPDQHLGERIIREQFLLQ
ncbi:MAG: NAD kinase [Alphaproteobacteria bacterium]|nr:NAD kinase [Alphaproteobacteria bacterium]